MNNKKDSLKPKIKSADCRRVQTNSEGNKVEQKETWKTDKTPSTS